MPRFPFLVLFSIGLVAQETSTPTQVVPLVPPPAVTSQQATPIPPPAPLPNPKPEAKPLPLLDKGLLDPSWFTVQPLTFSKNDTLDFFWIKPGLNLKDVKIKVSDWDSPTWMKSGRDERDRETVVSLMDIFPGLLKRNLEKNLADKVKVSRSEGNFVLTGRFVDCNAKSVAAKVSTPFFAGTENVTWDIKLVDANTGELLFAGHHRMVSGMFSTLERKLAEWAEDFSKFTSKQMVQ